MVAAWERRAREAAVSWWAVTSLELVLLVAMVVVLSLLLWRISQTHKLVVASSARRASYAYPAKVADPWL